MGLEWWFNGIRMVVEWNFMVINGEDCKITMANNGN